MSAVDLAVATRRRPNLLRDYLYCFGVNECKLVRTRTISDLSDEHIFADSQPTSHACFLLVRCILDDCRYCPSQHQIGLMRHIRAHILTRLFGLCARVCGMNVTLSDFTARTPSIIDGGTCSFHALTNSMTRVHASSSLLGVT
jgi:hypothetical protein